jgi:hypothetical protein
MSINAYFINKFYNDRELIGTFNNIYDAYKGTINNLIIEREVYYPYGNRKEKQEIARKVNMSVTPNMTKKDFSKLLHSIDSPDYYVKEWIVEFEPTELRRSRRIKQQKEKQEKVKQQKEEKKETFKVQIYTDFKFIRIPIKKTIKKSVILNGNSEKDIIDKVIIYLQSKNLLSFDSYQDFQEMFEEDEDNILIMKENEDFTSHLIKTINTWKELEFLCDICGWYFIQSTQFHFTNKKECNDGWTMVLHKN